MGLVQGAPYEDITFKIIGACMAVHNDLGPGHREETYERALKVKFEQIGLAFENQVNLEVFEENGALVALYRPDFIANEHVIIEIKAHTHNLTNDEMAQVIDYFAGSHCEIAVLVNFGRERLEWKRLFPPKKINEHRRKKWGKKVK